MVRLGGLWNRESKNGNPFSKGIIKCPHCDEPVQVIIFPNERQQSENSPDANVYLSEPKEKKGGYEKKSYSKPKTTKRARRPSVFD